MFHNCHQRIVICTMFPRHMMHGQRFLARRSFALTDIGID